MEIDLTEFEEMAARGMLPRTIFPKLGIAVADGLAEMATNVEIADCYERGHKRFNDVRASHERAIDRKAVNAEVVPAFAKPIEINEQVLSGQIRDPMTVAQALAAYGVPTEEIEALIGHAVDDAMVEQIAAAIETGRLQGRAFVASQLFEQIKQGKFPAIQFYLRTKGGPGWSEFNLASKDAGDSREKFLESLGFTKETIQQIRGIVGKGGATVIDASVSAG
jgi:hypothetical protein